MDRKKILIVEDETVVAMQLHHSLGQLGYAVTDVVATSTAAIASAKNVPPDLVVMDILLEGEMDGIEAAEALQTVRPVPVVFTTGAQDQKTFERALKTSPGAYVFKPVEPMQLAVAIAMSLKNFEAREGLRQSEERYRKIFENAGDAVIICETEGSFLDVNLVAASMLGYQQDELRSLTVAQIEGPKRSELRSGLSRAFTHGHHFCETALVTRKEALVAVEITMSKITFLDGEAVHCLIRDVTVRKDLELQLLHAQKMESVGQLAAGIAHEINTPAQYIGDNIRFLQDAFKDILSLFEFCDTAGSSIPAFPTEELAGRKDDMDYEFLRTEIPQAVCQSLEGVDKITRIVQATKKFSHPGSNKKTEADINEILENTLTVAQNEIKYHADVIREYAPDLSHIPCFPADLGQALLNIIVNAAHAVAQRFGDSPERGIIRIETAIRNGAAEIRIQDTGCGIPKENRDKIFHPFFTTKEVGKGTGQGLALTYTIIEDKHGGNISFESRKDEGTIFIIRLPLDTGEVAVPGPESRAEYSS
ncbi:MAG TPA: ATP-binding protein [Desulfomicrobiaceae bacterium]|nr:ATP-binding protein [Desulfomicrobiaceae bacterium]